jgi:amino-acid N-acetyltransferase
VKEAVGAVLVEIEARLSMGLARTPMAGARIRVASGNFVTARPMGIIDGVDHQHTGLVRNVDAEGIRQRLDAGAMVLLSPVGYSVTGDAFRLMPDDVAAAAAIALGADKLVALVEGAGVIDRKKRLIRELSPSEAAELLENGSLDEDVERHLAEAVRACTSGVRRVHLIPRELDGGILLELFTQDGIGTLVTAEAYEGIRTATLGDVGGILALIAPLEEQGVLVRRSREKLEMEIDRFVVLERDGHIVGCAALYPWSAERVGELACLAVQPEYREQGRGEDLLTWVERRARDQGLRHVFVLTTQTEHWFLERGFEPARIADLPVDRQQLYNVRRGSKVFVKEL